MPGLFLFGVLPVPEDITDSLPQLDGGPVPSHRPEAGDWFAPFQHDGNDCHLGCLPPGSFCGGLGCRDGRANIWSAHGDLFTIAADLLQDAGEARHGSTFLSSGAGVRMCPPYIPYSPGQLDNSLPGEIIFQSSENRSGAGRCVFGHVWGDRRFWGHFRGSNWDAWIWERICKTIRNQRYGKRKTPAWVCHAGVGGVASGD